MAVRKFRAKLTSAGPGGAWTYLAVPFDVPKEYGTRGRVSVKGTINGFAYRNSIFPMGGKAHTMMVNKALQAGAKAKPGQTVSVTMEADTADRPVPLPPDLKKTFSQNAKAKAAFAELSYTHRRDFATWVESAKGEDTRKERVARTLKMLREGITLASIQKARYEANKAKRR